MKIKPLISSVSILATALSSGYVMAESTPVPAVGDNSQVQPKSPEACIGLQANSARLACYDTYFSPPASITPVTAENTGAAVELAVVDESQIDAAEDATESLVDTIAKVTTLTASNLISASSDFDPSTSLLDQRWELSKNSKLGTWQLRSYQPMYMLPVMWTSDKNTTPYSPNPVNRVTDRQELNSTEAKFQVSLKTKAFEDVFGNNGDVWIGYTQSSRWQVYNDDTSRPFRETNYEPEASLVFRTNYNLLGLNGRLLGLTFNHQSNGRSDPFSRSWNRVILNVGFERDNFALILRPWYRLDEDAEDDNNPDITNYIGRGDLTAFYKWNEHNFSLMMRHSLKGGDNNRGALQFDWAFPLAGALRGHVQVFEGYGESLIDYNHKATYVGLGVSLLNWF